MIRRSLLRQSQTLYATSRYIDTFSPVSSALPVSHKRSQFVSLRIRSLQRSIAVRYFSSTDTPQDGANTDAAAVNASQSEIRTNDSVNEDLESKDKEIIDLKVRPKSGKPQSGLAAISHVLNSGQISPLSCRLP